MQKETAELAKIRNKRVARGCNRSHRGAVSAGKEEKRPSLRKNFVALGQFFFLKTRHQQKEEENLDKIKLTAPNRKKKNDYFSLLKD